MISFIFLLSLLLLQDTNDNAPRFEKDQIYISVDENQPVGHMIGLSGAVDLDMSVNNNIDEYRLLPFDQNTFRLDTMTAQDGVTTNLGLIVEQPLDRETKHLYHLQVFEKNLIVS